MFIIHHRRNTLDLLRKTPSHLGVEIDIRSYGPDLVVHHDPFVGALSMDEWLSAYNHKFIILNTKEEGLEERLLSLMACKGIQDFFFLDQSFPFLIKTARSGEKRCAVRVSEYESVDTALSLAGQIDWVWVDVFTKFPLSCSQYDLLKSAGFKLCLVSPELQQHPSTMLTAIKERMEAENMVMDAVCTKFPEAWE